jgi:hypothetical protein
MPPIRGVVSITDECIEWDMSLNEKGYGRVSVGHGWRRIHRVAWEEANGPVPPGMLVLRRCDNPPCFNVDHLFLGTNDENMADRQAKGRTARGAALPNGKKTACPYGHPYVATTSEGHRICRTCQANRARARYWRNKENP